MNSTTRVLHSILLSFFFINSFVKSCEFHPTCQDDASNGGTQCQSSEDCDEELKEACAQWASGDVVKFRCSCTKPVDDCISELGVDVKKIHDCINAGPNSEGAKILKENREHFAKLGTEDGSMPLVVFNDQRYDQCTDNAAYEDFLGVSCELFKPDPKLRPPCYLIEL